MKNREHGEPIPDWKCERYLLGELEESEMELIRRRAEQDQELQTRLTELELSGREILQRYPAGMMAHRVEARLAAAEPRAVPLRRRHPLRLTWVPVAAAALVAGILWLNPDLIPGRPSSWPDSGDPAGIRPKGPAAALSLYRRTADGSERLENRAVAVEHDLIGARYQADGQTYGLIVSVDGRGVLTRHLPQRDDEAVLLAAGSHTLDFSYELDDAPRWEIFLLASSKSAFAVAAVLQAIEGSALMQSPDLPAGAAEAAVPSLQLPEGISISAFTLIKEAGDER